MKNLSFSKIDAYEKEYVGFNGFESREDYADSKNFVPFVNDDPASDIVFICNNNVRY